MEELHNETQQERAVLVGLNADCFTKEQTATDQTLWRSWKPCWKPPGASALGKYSRTVTPLMPTASSARARLWK